MKHERLVYLLKLGGVSKPLRSKWEESTGYDPVEESKRLVRVRGLRTFAVWMAAFMVLSLAADSFTDVSGSERIVLHTFSVVFGFFTIVSAAAFVALMNMPGVSSSSAFGAAYEKLRQWGGNGTFHELVCMDYHKLRMLAKEILRDQVVLIRKLDLSSEDFPEEEIIAEKRALHDGLAERLNTLKRLGLVDQHEGYDSYFRMVEQLLVEEEAKEAS